MFRKWKVAKGSVRCHDVEAMLERYADGRLPPATAAAFDAHLAACSACRRLVQDEPRWLNQLRRSQWERLTPAETAAMQLRLYGSLRRKTIVRNIRTMIQSALALVILSLFVGLFVWQSQGDDWTAVPRPQPQQSDNGRRITFAARLGSQVQYEAIIAQFQEIHPDIQVQFVSYPGGLGRMLTAQEQAEAADTMLIVSPPQNHEAGYFVDLNPLMDGDAGFDPTLFWPNALSGCQSGDAIYGLPLRLDFNLLFYDAVAFEAAGLPTPTPGWTWEAFVLAVEALTEQEGDRTIRYGFADLNSLLRLLEPIFDESLSGQEAAIEQLQPFLRDVERLVFGNHVAVMDDPDASRQELNNLIGNGRTAIWFEPPMMLASRRQELGNGINVAPVPTLSNLTRTTPIYTTCAAISSGTADREAAWLWLTYLAEHYPAAAELGGVLAHQARAMSDNAADLAEDAPVGYAVRHPWFIANRSPVEVLRLLIYDALVNGVDAVTAVAESAPNLRLSPPGSPPLSAPVIVASPPPLASDAQEIRFYDFITSFYAGPLREFHERHPDIRVTVSRDLPGRLETEGFNIADVAEHYDCLNWPWSMPGLQDYADFNIGELFFSLSPLLDAEPASFRDDFYPGTLAYLTVDGQTLALPLSVQPLAIRYNANYFAENGFEPPPMDWTAADLFILAAQTARHNDDQDTVYGYATAFTGGRADPLEWFAASQGYPLWNVFASPPTVHFDDPGVAAVLRTWVRLVEEVAVYPATGAGSRALPATADPYRLINNKQVAMWLAPVAWLLNEDPGRPTGLAPIPEIRLDAPPPLLAGLYISRRSAQPAACWEWIKFLTEQAIISPGVPARQSVMYGPMWETVVGPDNAAALRLSLQRHLAQVNLDGVERPEVGPLRRWLVDVLMAAYTGAPVEPLLTEAQQKGEAYLSCIARYTAPDAAEVDQCAQQADPGYLTSQELYANE